jgi:two-component sensor histidine kinase
MEMLLLRFRSLVWAWNAFGFGATACLAFVACARRERPWGGVLTGLVLGNSALAYLLNVLLHGPVRLWGGFQLGDAIQGALNFTVLPMLVHLFYREERAHLRRPGLWRAVLIGAYLTAAAGIAVFAAPSPGAFWPAPRLPRYPVFAAALAACCILVGLLLREAGAGKGPAQKKLARGLFVALGVFGVLEVISAMTGSLWTTAIQDLVPAGVVFVLAYWVQPLTFDVLVREISFAFFLLVVVCMVWWGLQAQPQMNAPRALAIWVLCAWPAVAITPWLHRKWVRWLDRALLGRLLTPNEARTCFLAALEGALTEEDLAGSAERALEEIFGSQARIAVHPSPAAAPAGMREPLRSHGQESGSIEVAPRPRYLQFMNTDKELLASLAGEFSIMLENLRLREKKLEQERREKDLQILATRAELKALRAQINPHFLFNSLSAIAGLISKDSSRAQQTVEQLAEVFRYSLYRSEKEWVRLADELDFADAYLDVERARFGARLQFEVQVEEAARQVMVPAMVLQVLVENAIKHGVSAVRGPAIVAIHGNCRERRLRLEVRDNGRGCEPGAPKMPGAGFGLRNLQERLQLYFGASASLRIGRDGSMTSVVLEMPAVATPLATEGQRA